MFRSERLQDLIEFKWNAYAWRFHLFGCMIHFAYIIILFRYTDVVYVQGAKELKAAPAAATSAAGSTLRMLRASAGGGSGAVS